MLSFPRSNETPNVVSYSRPLRAEPAPEPAEARPQPPWLRSFFAGGFECSTFRLRSGRRLDLIESTAHDKFALQDYLRLQREGLRVAREGVRWHLVEAVPGRYDFSSVLPIVRAARATASRRPAPTISRPCRWSATTAPTASPSA